MVQLVNLLRLMSPDNVLDDGVAAVCALGQWLFNYECQSGQILTIGL